MSKPTSTKPNTASSVVKSAIKDPLGALQHLFGGRSEQTTQRAELVTECGRVLTLWEQYRITLGVRSMPEEIAALMPNLPSYKGIPKNATMPQLEKLKADLATEAQLVLAQIEKAVAEKEEVAQAEAATALMRRSFSRDISAANVAGVRDVGAYSGRDRSGQYIERKDTGANVVFSTKVLLGEGVLKQIREIKAEPGQDSKGRPVLWFDQRHDGVLIRIKVQTDMSAEDLKADLANWETCRIDQWTNPVFVRPKGGGKPVLRPDDYGVTEAPWREYTLTLWKLDDRLASAKTAATVDIYAGGYLELHDWAEYQDSRDFVARAKRTYEDKNGWLLEHYGAQMVRPEHVAQMELQGPVWNPDAAPAEGGNTQVVVEPTEKAKPVRTWRCNTCKTEITSDKHGKQMKSQKCTSSTCNGERRTFSLIKDPVANPPETEIEGAEHTISTEPNTNGHSKTEIASPDTEFEPVLAKETVTA